MTVGWVAAAQQCVLRHRDAADVVAFLLAAACYATAIAVRRRPDRAIACIVAGGVVLALAMAMDGPLHRWDERFHAVVGKSLLRDPLTPILFDDPARAGKMNWTRARVWLHKPPLSLWLIAGSLYTFGVSTLAVRLPSIALFAVAVWATHRLGALWFSARVGLVAAALHSLNGHLLSLASGRVPTDHPDSVFVSLVGIGVLVAMGQLRRSGRLLAIAVGTITGLALLTKWLPGLLILGLWGAAMARAPGRLRSRGVDVGLAVAALLAVALPWQLHIWRAFPAEAAFESAYNVRHLREALEGHTGSALYHVARFPRLFGELAWLAVGWFVWNAARRRSEGDVVVILWFAVPYLFFSLVATKMPSYVMIAAPAVFLMIGAAVVRLVDDVRAQDAGVWRRRLGVLLAVLLVALPARFTLERWRPLHNEQPPLASEPGDPLSALFAAP